MAIIINDWDAVPDGIEEHQVKAHKLQGSKGFMLRILLGAG